MHPECIEATIMSLVLNVLCQNTVRHSVLRLFWFLVKTKKRANPKIDPSAVINCHATYVRLCQPAHPVWREHNAVSWTGWNVLMLQQQ